MEIQCNCRKYKKPFSLDSLIRSPRNHSMLTTIPQTSQNELSRNQSKPSRLLPALPWSANTGDAEKLIIIQKVRAEGIFAGTIQESINLALFKDCGLNRGLAVANHGRVRGAHLASTREFQLLIIICYVWIEVLNF